MGERSRRGSDVVEYSLVLMALALALLVTVGQLRDSVAAALNQVVGGVSGMSRCIDDQRTDFCQPTGR